MPPGTPPAIRVANAMQPEFVVVVVVVVVGDMIDDASNAQQVEELFRITRGLRPGIPMRWVPGNHDIALDTLAPTDHDIDKYREIFGADYYTFDSGAARFVVLNTVVIDHPEHVPGELDEQLEFLRFELARAAADGVDQLALLGHHPLFVESPDEDDTYWNLPRERSGHGGQILMSATTAALNERNLPPSTMLRDHGSHELKELAYPEHIYQLVVEGLPEEFPALRTLSARKTNLPTRDATFFGRVEGTSSVGEAMQKDRLVTLAGPAGVGKSSLAIETASRIADSFSDGVWLVDVSRVGDEVLIASAVAKQLNITESGPHDLADLVVMRLLRASILLILDGCEHLVVEVGRFVEKLLSSTSQVRILVTTRQPLAIDGEQLIRVAPLSVPPSAVTGVDVLERFDSVALFVDRARAVQPSFELTDKVAQSVAEICRHLDGLPLAIELAAAQMSEWSVREIADRLDRKMTLGNSDRRGPVGDLRTLEATLDWSHESLGPDERALFARLSVFAGGFTPEAAKSVCSDGSLPPDQVGHVLDRLVDASLVLASREQPIRYRLLEPISRYARSRLVNGEGLDGVQRRHAAFFLDLAQTADPQLRGPEQARWAVALELERYNLRAALRWSRVHDTETSLRLAGALRWFWVIQRDVTEGATWLRSALADRGRAEPGVVAQALNGVGLLAFRALDLVTARRAVTETLNIFEQLGNQGGIARQTYHLAVLAWFEDDDKTARERLEKAEALCRHVGDHGTSLGRWRFEAPFSGRQTTSRTLSLAWSRATRNLATSAEPSTSVGPISVSPPWLATRGAMSMQPSTSPRDVSCWQSTVTKSAWPMQTPASVRWPG